MPTYDDYREAYLRKWSRWAFVVIIAAATVVVSLISDAAKQFAGERQIIFAYGQLFAAVMVVCATLYPIVESIKASEAVKRLWADWEGAPGDVVLRVDDNGLKFEYPLLRMEIDWALYKGIRQTSHLLLLDRGKAFDVIPKRAFNSVEEYERFLGLFSQKSRGTIEADKRGFAVIIPKENGRPMA